MVPTTRSTMSSQNFGATAPSYLNGTYHGSLYRRQDGTDITTIMRPIVLAFEPVVKAFKRLSASLQKLFASVHREGGSPSHWATGVPRHAPPVPLVLCALPRHAGAPRRPLESRPALGPPLRLHARQSVPARTRRKLRTWERP
jgi:hypothetical protein